MVETTEDELARAEREIEELSTASELVARPGRTSDPAECDVIMKGRITSGVVYPLTICKLATRYRRRSIGGTSAGAIAAVIAAAEYRRHHDEAAPAAGCQALAQLPPDISIRLASLFQPPPRTRRIFGVLLAVQGPGGGRAPLTAVVRQQLGSFLAGMAAVLVVVLPGLLLTTEYPLDGSGVLRILVGLLLPLLGVIVGLVAAVVTFVVSALRVLPQEDFGLTDGATYSGDPDEPALTQWLADEIDRVAGISARAASPWATCGAPRGYLAATERLLAIVQEWRTGRGPALREDWPSPAPQIRMAPR